MRKKKMKRQLCRVGRGEGSWRGRGARELEREGSKGGDGDMDELIDRIAGML